MSLNDTGKSNKTTHVYLFIHLFNQFYFILFYFLSHSCDFLNLLVNNFPKIFPYNILICNSLPQSHLRIRKNELHPVYDIFSFIPSFQSSFIHSFFSFFLSFFLFTPSFLFFLSFSLNQNLKRKTARLPYAADMLLQLHDVLVHFSAPGALDHLEIIPAMLKCTFWSSAWANPGVCKSSLGPQWENLQDELEQKNRAARFVTEN